MVAMVQMPARAAYASMSKDELIEALEAHNRTLQGIYEIIHMENAKMAPGEKLFWIGARNVLAQEKPNEEGLVRLPTDKVAEFIGMSESSAGRYANSVIERYEATKVPVPYTTLKGQDRTLTYVNRDDPLWHEPWAVELPEEKERTINGNGKQCPRCHTDNLKITPRRIKYQEIQECECCGYKKVSGILDDNDPLPPSEYIPPKLDEIEEAEKGPQAGEPFESDEKALTSAPAYDPVTPTIVPEVSPAAVEVEGCNNLLQLPASKMTPGDLSLEEWLTRRIGTVPHKLIQATGKMTSADKYISLPEDYVLDMSAYLRGELEHIYGSNLRNTDGTTRVLEFDYDTVEQSLLKFDILRLLASAGAAAICWPRRPGRGHLGLYFDTPVNAQAAYQWAITVCPLLADFKECYPVKGIEDKRNQRLSWPLWYRDGDQVIECAAIAMLPGENKPTHCAGMKSDPEGLRAIVAQAVTPAALIPELPVTQASDEAPARGGLLLEKPLERRTACSNSTDVAKLAIRSWNDAHTWEEIADVRNGRFLASWRGEHTPSVVIDPDGCHACDYGNHGNFPKKVDRFEAWCLINGLDRRAEKERLCIAYRERQEVSV